MDTCENCGAALGKIEGYSLYQGQKVCKGCYSRLAPATPPPSAQPQIAFTVILRVAMVCILAACVAGYIHARGMSDANSDDATRLAMDSVFCAIVAIGGFLATFVKRTY